MSNAVLTVWVVPVDVFQQRADDQDNCGEDDKDEATIQNLLEDIKEFPCHAKVRSLS